MKNTFGSSVSVTLFGESHGKAIGAVLDGMAPGIPFNPELLAHQMMLRRASTEPSLSTSRKEKDEVRVVSGVYRGMTTGTPITFLIENEDTHSADYDKMNGALRPGHADFTAHEKYHGFQDARGGGHFSGRITAGLCAAGAVAITALERLGIRIGTHIASCGGISDRPFGDLISDISYLNHETFAVLDAEKASEMRAAIAAARESGDSVGGILETAVTGMPAGVGEPFFDTVESVISHILFAIPAVKGVSFGDGFELAAMTGSTANDAYEAKEGKIRTRTNHAGGILGGITNGMPLLIRTAIKPTPSIYKEQETVALPSLEARTLKIEGRHDPAIVHRARVVADSAIALALCDLLALRYGTDFLAGGDRIS